MPKPVNPAVALGKLRHQSVSAEEWAEHCSKAGNQRAKKLTKARRKAIAKQAAAASAIVRSRKAAEKRAKQGKTA